MFVLPAFEGAYDLEIDVPGEDSFKESVVIGTVSFHGLSPESGLDVDIAKKHGRTEVLWR